MKTITNKDLYVDLKLLNQIIARYDSFENDPRVPAGSYSPKAAERFKSLAAHIKEVMADKRSDNPIVRLKAIKDASEAHALTMAAAEHFGNVTCMYFEGCRGLKNTTPYMPKTDPVTISNKKIRGAYIRTEHVMPKGTDWDEYIKESFPVYTVCVDVGGRSDYAVYRTLDKDEAEEYIKKIDQEVNKK